MEGYPSNSYSDFETAEQNNALVINTVLRDGAGFPEAASSIESAETHPERGQVLDFLDDQSQQVVGQVAGILDQLPANEAVILEDLTVPKFNFPEEETAAITEHPELDRPEDPLQTITAFWENLEAVNDADGTQKPRRLAA